MFEDGSGYGTFLACQVRLGRGGERKRVWNNPPMAELRTIWFSRGFFFLT